VFHHLFAIRRTTTVTAAATAAPATGMDIYAFPPADHEGEAAARSRQKLNDTIIKILDKYRQIEKMSRQSQMALFNDDRYTYQQMNESKKEEFRQYKQKMKSNRDMAMVLAHQSLTAKGASDRQKYTNDQCLSGVNYLENSCKKIMKKLNRLAQNIPNQWLSIYPVFLEASRKWSDVDANRKIFDDTSNANARKAAVKKLCQAKINELISKVVTGDKLKKTIKAANAELALDKISWNDLKAQWKAITELTQMSESKLKKID
jgi:hypothetical protein